MRTLCARRATTASRPYEPISLHALLGSALIAGVLLILGFLPLDAMAGTQTPGATADANAAAAFLIDDGEREPVYVVVSFAERDISAVELLRTTDLPVVTVSFGGLGEGVCSIVETGCDVSACRRRLCQTGDPESPFWQFWRQDEDGQWAASTLGASHSEVDSGDIDAWVWTGVEPELEPIEWRAIAELARAPEAIVDGNFSGPPGVWSSHVGSASSEDERDLTGTLVSVGLVAALAGGGFLLIWMQRPRQDDTQ